MRFWSRQPGAWFCYATAVRAPGAKKLTKWREHWHNRPGEPPPQSPGVELYFCPHGFKANRRVKENAVPGNWLWADLDAVDPQTVRWRPTVAWETSPGRYAALWRLTAVPTYELWESLLRGMTQSCGADAGGWDPTQVLRVPGSRNWKYPGGPRGRMLWDDGPVYPLSALPRAVAESASVAASSLYTELEPLIPVEARRLLMATRAVGDRSRVLWRLESMLLEAGLAVEDVKQLCMGCVWNKFKDRPEQFEKEFERLLKRRVAVSNVVRELDEGIDLSEVKPEKVQWLVENYIPLRALTLLEGDPGVGKSFLLASLFAGVTRTGRWLGTNVKTGKVMYFTFEDDAETTIQPRLAYAGADLKKVRLFDHSFSIPDKQDWLEKLVEAYQPRVVVFDTVLNYFGAGDMFKGNEVAHVIGFLRYLAYEYSCSVIAVRHLTKQGGRSALYRGQGAMNFVGLARSVLTIGEHPEDVLEEYPRKIMAVTKMNLAAKPPARVFDIVTHTGGVGRVVFEGVSTVSADEVVEGSVKEKRSSAKEVIKTMINGEWMLRSEIEKQCEARSISLSTLSRALRELVESRVLEQRGGHRGNPSEYRTVER